MQDMNGIWAKYTRDRSDALRNALIEHYLPIVRYSAERIHAKLPDEVELDDLISVGVFGLMDAIAAFDPERGIKFETYCAPRIRGAILDELRSMDWVPRLVRSRANKLTAATRQLEAELGRSPTGEEMARRLGVPAAEYDRMAKDAHAIGMVSLSRKLFEGEGGQDVTEVDILEDRRALDPVRETQRRDLKRLIAGSLTRAERLILILYYFEQMTMKEVGAALDLSESRVSQMHSSILARLKAQMADRKKEFHQAAAV
jgi:RNA polymerase sigma factor for flagellar operon FliA